MSKYSNKTTSSLIYTGSGKVHGFLVNSHSSGTLKLWDSTSATGNVIMDTFTFPAGSSIQTFPSGVGDRDGVSFYTGLYATIGGTANVTILFDQNA